MKTGTELLCDLFKGAGGDEPVGQGGGRILPSNVVVYEPTGPVQSPHEWLQRFQIPIVEQSPAELDKALARFRCRAKGGAIEYAAVEIPRGSDIDKGIDRWAVWHEIGHALDYVSCANGIIVPMLHGQFSTLHLDLLRQHQETIIEWHPHANRAYKTQPCELWAETVAASICESWRVPPALLQAVRPDLVRWYLPV